VAIATAGFYLVDEDLMLKTGASPICSQEVFGRSLRKNYLVQVQTVWSQRKLRKK
jgi:hypothetical protein